MFDSMSAKKESTFIDARRKKKPVLGKVLKDIREKLGLSQAEVAELIQKGRQSISKCETREGDFTLKLIVELWKQPGGYSSDEIFMMLDKMPWPPPKPGPKRKAAERLRRAR